MWAPVGQIANVAQLSGLDAISLIFMIVRAAERSRMHKKNCMKIAEYVQLIVALLVPLNIPELMTYPETRAPLELLENALRNCYNLVNRCRDRSFLYLLAMGWNVEKQFKEAQSEVEQYLKLIPLIILVDRQRFRERSDTVVRDRSEHARNAEDNILLGGPSIPRRSSRQRERRRATAVTRNPLMRAVEDALACFKFKGEEEVELGVERNVPVFTFEELSSATEGFAKDNLVCPYPEIYKGMLHGISIAVKKREKGETHLLEEFKNEINILSALSHPNIIKLLGYCNTKDQLFLIYDFVANGNLEHLLLENQEPLSWEKRIKIAINTAKGLQYLHMPENNIIHLDIKPATILLDSVFNIKLSGFEVSMHGPVGGVIDDTVVRGTLGYVDPQFFITAQPTTKSDVYSFGVVLLQLLSGQKVFNRSPEGEFQSFLVQRAAEIIGAEDGSIVPLVDPQLHGQYPLMAATELGKLGLSCTSLDHESRPCMEEIVNALEAIDFCTHTSTRRLGVDKMQENWS